MLAEIRGSCKQNREFANIAQKCFQNLANKKSVWSLCKVVQTKKTSHKVRGVLLREGLYKAFASCLSSAAVSGFLSSSIIELLEDPKVIKVGLSLKDDFMMLHKRAPFNQQACIELQEYVRPFGIQDKSLQKIYGILFSEKISKSQRLSNWEADVLTDAQKQYAATDAWACLNIYHLLEELKRTGNYELAPEEEATEKVKVGSDQQ